MKRFIAVLFVIAALAPFVLGSDRTASAAHAVLLLVAASGLGVAVSFAGLPSLGQGAFVGVGAYAVAVLRAKAGWDPVTSLVVAVALSSVVGEIVARGVARLRVPFVALATWLVAWTFSFAVAAFPNVSGGTAGISLGATTLRLRTLGVSATLGSTAFFEIALASLALVLAGTAIVVRRYGPAFAAVRSDPSAAAAAGVPVARLRHGAIVASAAIGGFAGALGVQVAGVADPTAYGPLLSVELFIVVLLGGAAVAGPIAGGVAFAVVIAASHGIASLAGGSTVRLAPLAAGAVLVAVVALGGEGIAPRLLRRRRGVDPETSRDIALRGASLDVRDLVVEFEGVRALDGVSLHVDAGACHAIVGPNGSGKTTLLRVSSGALTAGDVLVDGAAVAPAEPHERVATGIARTFQRLVITPGMTSVESALVGTEATRKGGLWRSLFHTPGAHEDALDARAHAEWALGAVGLFEKRHVLAQDLTNAEQRMLQVARALASRPRILLLDEPSAGMGPAEIDVMRKTIERLNAGGLTIVLVEHNLRLVRALADRVTVLDAGRVIAEGTVEEIAMADVVRDAYLGPAPIASAHAEDAVVAAPRSAPRVQQQRADTPGDRGDDRRQRPAGKSRSDLEADRAGRAAGRRAAERKRKP